ncbi:cadherin-like domain-containing protein [Flavobacterium sp. 7A]|uniref:cadherin-like domain-containing protein n=1 Tax=Flavobacterium sp. 7A TaxID=2940571 RepID=UPI0039B3E5CE
MAVTNDSVSITAGGVITFTPAVNYKGEVRFPYVITDGILTDDAEEVITVTSVNDATSSYINSVTKYCK